MIFLNLISHGLLAYGSKQLFRIMKLTIIIITLFLMQVSAAGLAQKVTLQRNNASLRSIFTEIRRQTGYNVIYQTNQLRRANLVNVNVENASLEYTLNQILAGQRLSFIIKDKAIVIKKSEIPFLYESTDQFKFIRVKGKVTDEKGQPVPGVTVLVKGSNKGAGTDVNGVFTIDVPTNGILVISSVGYKTQEINVGTSTELNIVLKESPEELGELVVVGYGTQKKLNLTGALTSVNMDEVLGNRPVSTTATLLQAAAPGLTVNISSGEPGAGASFNVRGATDISTTGSTINDGSPLILVDNVPFNGTLNLLDPNDIENVTVLKDAGSAAIYGGRSAYGVILITTKKGVKNQKAQFNYSNNVTFVAAQNLPKKATPLQTVQSFKDMGTAGYWSGQNVDIWLGLLNEYAANPAKYPDGYTFVNKIRYPLSQTDAIANLLGNNAVQQMHNLSINGGSDKNTYRISVGLVDEPGIIAPETKQDYYKRYNAKSFISSDIAPWFTAQFDAAYYKSTKKSPSSPDQFGQASNLPSYVSMRDTITATNGTRGVNGTPKNLIALSAPTVTDLDDIRMTGRTIFKPVKDLVLTAEYTFDNLRTNQESYDKKYSYINVSNFQLSNGGTGVYQLTDGVTYYKALNVYGNYTKSLGSHNLALVLGLNKESNSFKQNSAQRDGMIAGDFPSLAQATGPITATNSLEEYSLSGYFGRFNYDYKGKYLFEFNGRYDGSSKFPDGHRWGFFPSASAGWRISEESFLKSLKPVLNDFKVRASLGEVGNQNIAPYQFVAVMTGYNPQWLNGTTALLNSLNPPGLISSTFTWAKVRTLDFGADFGFIGNRLTGSFDWYKRDTKDILATGEIPLPAVLGTGAPLQNTAAVASKGYELQLNWKDKIGSVGYRIGVNIYDYKSTVTKFSGNSAGLLNKYYEGQRSGEIWGYTTDRLYTVDDFVTGSLNQNLTGGTLKPGVVKFQGQNPNPGDVMFKDLNNDGIIFSGKGTLADPGDRRIIGNSTPRYQYGINGGLNWKGFDFSFVITGVGKQDLWLANPLTLPNNYAFGTIYAHQLDYWTATHPNAFFGRIYDQAAGNQSFNQTLQSKYLLNGAYLKIKNLSLAYNLPAEWLKKIHLNKAAIFYSIENAYTFHHLPKGLDPSVQGRQYGLGYPFMRMSSIGVNLSF